MMISTKGRYALRFMADLAQHRNGSFIPLKEAAERQDISLKYLERIALTLTQVNMIESSHGKGGGYRLTREPEAYTVLEILEIIEGDIAPVACLGCNASPCDRASLCPTLEMWKGFHQLTKDYFKSITLSDLVKRPTEPDYII
ncbi:MAG: Rrf2 family transcriptional regulator [Spirochaetales bacterium]|nr:Rrf2 family transcriptional regulator [Candidatus Physcosoma equi]